MEKLDLYRLGLFMEEEIILVPEEAEEILQKEKLKSKFSTLEKDEDTATSIENAVVEDVPMEGLTAVSSEIDHDVLISYEGGFEKGLLVIYQGKELEEEHREFLIKILGAVSHSIKDIALVAADQINMGNADSIQRLNPHKIMVFGQLNHPINQFKKINYEMVSEEETEYLFADDQYC